MENATEALIMAGSVLLLIIALTVNISSLMGLKTQVQDFLTSKDQVQLITDKDGNYINYVQSDRNAKARKVGVETIISAIRRMAKENYVIYIKSNNIDTSGIEDDLKITSEDNSISKIDKTDKLLNITQKGNILAKRIEKTEVIKKVYEMLKDNTYYEYLGIYKEEKKNEGVLEAERDTYKIITFVQAS